MYEMVDTYKSRSSRVACASAKGIKNDREKYKRGYEGQIKGPYPVEKMQMTRGHIQINDQLPSQVSEEEAPKKTQ